MTGSDETPEDIGDSDRSLYLVSRCRTKDLTTHTCFRQGKDGRSALARLVDSIDHGKLGYGDVTLSRVGLSESRFARSTAGQGLLLRMLQAKANMLAQHSLEDHVAARFNSRVIGLMAVEHQCFLDRRGGSEL